MCEGPGRADHRNRLMTGGFVLHDMVDQPDFNWSTQNDRGDWSLRDVSAGAVFAGADGKPRCVDHGAMNAVTPRRDIWRCLMCGRATYVVVITEGADS